MADALYPNPNSIIAFAGAEADAANNFVLSLSNVANSLTPPVISPVFPSVSGTPVPITTMTPSMQTVVWESPAAPDAFTGSLNIDSLLPAPFDESPPSLFFGSAPTPITELAPDAPGIDLQMVYPDLNVNLPAAPSLLSLSTYSFDGVSLPTIDSNIPELTAASPSLIPYTNGSGYTSSLLSAVQSTLLSRVTVGGTGLSPAVEEAIWNRGREREYRQMADGLAELERMESLGYAFPPGVYMDARYKLQTEMGNQSNLVSREIMIKQAELELDNVKSSLNLAVQMESSLLTYTNQVEQRLFEASKYATEAGISIYNAKVHAYTAYLDAYKTKVSIYEAQIRGELAKVEVYKSEIAAEQVKAQINSALVEQFKIKTDAALSTIEVFKAQINAIATKAEIEKIKVQVYGEQVRGYTAKIGAYTAGVEGYRASIQAESVKQEAYKSKVAAYSAVVDAAVKSADAKIKEYAGKLEAKTTEWEGYKAAYAGQASRAQAISAVNATIADAYRSEVTAVSSYNDTMTKQWQAALEQAQRVAEIGVSAAKANGDLYMTTRSLALDAAKVGAQVSAQLGASALNAINWSNSFSSSMANSTSTSTSSVESNSTSTSTNYNYSV